MAKRSFWHLSLPLLLLLLGFCLGGTQAFAQTTNWTLDANGVWDTATNWSPTTQYPSGLGASAVLGMDGANTATNRLIRSGVNVTLGNLTITNNNNYEFSGVHTLTFDSIGNGTNWITVAGSGTHKITSDWIIKDNLIITQLSSGVFTMSGADITVASKSLIKRGSGVLELTSDNLFGNGLFIEGGTVRVYLENSMGDGGTNITLNGGTLNVGGNLKANAQNLGYLALGGGTYNPKTYTILDGGGTIDVSNNMTLTMSGDNIFIGSGALAKTGLGTMLITGNNTNFYSANFSILQGIVSISAENNLGALTNDVTINGGTLLVTTGFTANTNKVFTAGTNGGTLSIGEYQNLSLASSSNLAGSGTSYLIKDGLGTLTLSGNNSNTFFGTNILKQGTVRITAENNLGALTNDVVFQGGTLSVGASITANLGKQFIFNNSTGTVNIDASQTLTLSATNQLTGSGAALLQVTGNGTLALTGTNANFIGNVSIDTATLSLGGAKGTFTGATNFTVTRQGALVLDNSGTINSDRVANTASITLNGGKLRFTGGSGASKEAVGALNLTGGANTVEISRVSGNNSVLAIAQLSLTTPAATVLFANTGSGTLGSSGNNPRIGITGGGNNNGIMGGWALAQESITSPINFASIQNSTNVVALSVLWSTNRTAEWGAATNARVASTTAGIAVDRSLNSLTISNSSLTLSNHMLTLTSGGILVQSSSEITNGRLTTTGNTLYEHVVSGATFGSSATITNASATPLSFVKSLGGTAIFTVTNSYTGTTYVNQGTLQLGINNAISDSSRLQVESGAIFNMTNFSDAVAGISGAGSILLGSGTLTNAATSGSSTFSGTISGTGGLVMSGLQASQVLSGTNTYSGNTRLNGGALVVSQAENLGAATNDIIFNGGGLLLTDSFTNDPNRILIFTNANSGGTIFVDSGKTVSFLNTNMAGPGNLTNAGPGTLVIGASSTNNARGKWVINAGELKVQGATNELARMITSTFASNNITGSGGMFTMSSTTENSTNRVFANPGSQIATKQGFDMPSFISNTWYVIDGPVTNGVAELNWGGLAVKGGSVQFVQSTTYVRTNSSLDLSGGNLLLAGGDPGGSRTLTIKGDATLSGGILSGGPLGGSQGTLVVGGNIVSSGTILINGPYLVMNPDAGITTSISGPTPLNGAVQFKKQGLGTVRLDTSIYVSSGVEIDSGTLLLGANDRINDAAAIDMKGGVFATGGFSDTVGALTLEGDAGFDLGSGTGSILAFDDSSPLTWTSGKIITISNYTDSSEKIYFGTTSGGLTSDQLADFIWKNPYGDGSDYNGAIIEFDGRIRPKPVPEPATIAAVSFLALTVLWRERKRLSALLHRPKLRPPAA